MRIIEDRLKETYDENKEHIINLFLALQRQNFVMGNSLTNLIKQWPPPPTIEEEGLKFGILLETKD